MKKFYPTLITLLIVTQSNIAAAGKNVDVQQWVTETPRDRATSVDARSVAESHRSCGTAMLSQHRVYSYETTTERANIRNEYIRVSDAYTDLLKITRRTDERINALLENVRRELPSDDDDASADEDQVTLLCTAVEQLIDKLFAANTAKEAAAAREARLRRQAEQHAEAGAREARLRQQFADEAAVREARLRQQVAKAAEREVRLREELAEAAEREARLQQQTEQRLDEHQARWERYHAEETQEKNAEIAELQAQLEAVNQRAIAQAAAPGSEQHSPTGCGACGAFF